MDPREFFVRVGFDAVVVVCVTVLAALHVFDPNWVRDILLVLISARAGLELPRVSKKGEGGPGSPTPPAVQSVGFVAAGLGLLGLAPWLTKRPA